mmetsp:Transcript_40096/g.84091  ORF Transcript_40096/g.84091 Transcript_40096/m.84091 type:complete len:595 (+) Transcript_40096:67-1851(+)
MLLRRAAIAGAAAATAAYGLLCGAEDEYQAINEADLPEIYDPHEFAKVWGAHPRCAVSRLGEIACKAAPVGCVLLADAVGDTVRRLVGREASEETIEARTAERARRVRTLLTDLGPTFIKFGQMLSIRPDVIPPAAVYELQKLCDAVPPYPTAVSLALIQEQLGCDPALIFAELEATSAPIAAASLGQVFKCRLKSSDEQVALKVQRPDMVRAVSRDLYLLRRYMAAVEWFKEKVLTGLLGAAERGAFDVNLLDTFAGASFLELDYRHEAANMQRFTDTLLPMLNGKVYIPKCHHDLTTRKVLVSEWIEGEQLAKSSASTINALIPIGVDCFLAQLLVVGYFHSDPHPGNLLVDAAGRLVLIDFGLCAEIDAFDSRALTSALVHLMRGDVAALVEDAVALRFLPRDVDRAELLPPLTHIFNKGKLAAEQHLAGAGAVGAAGGVAGGGVAAERGGESRANVATRRAQFSAISRELNQIFFNFPFSVPEYFALITRALIVLEGIALTGDKDFDLFSASYPLALRHAARLFGPKQLATMLGEARAQNATYAKAHAAEQAQSALNAQQMPQEHKRADHQSCDEIAAPRSWWRTVLGER